MLMAKGVKVVVVLGPIGKRSKVVWVGLNLAKTNRQGDEAGVLTLELAGGQGGTRGHGSGLAHWHAIPCRDHSGADSE
jgi:hypothetical protein